MTGQDLLARLSELDSCSVSDALDRAHLPGVVTGIHSIIPGKKIAGRSVTVKLKPKDSGTNSTRHLGSAAIDSSSSEDIIVVANSGRMDVAGWGGILTVAAKHKGIKGVVIDGACRDADEVISLDYPVYARAAVPTSARGRVVEESFNEVVKIGDVAVRPGDLVLCDGSGVVFVRFDRAEEIIQSAEGIALREAVMVKEVLNGTPVSTVMGTNYENMLKTG